MKARAWKLWLSYFRNTTSVVGLVVAVTAGIFHLGLFAMEFGAGFHNPYLNIWYHIILPPFVVLGFALAFSGAWRHRRRMKKFGALAGETQWLVRPKQKLAIVGGFVLLLLVPFLGLTSYTGYNYTDSVEFCGSVCHVPMTPVFTAYQVSPHARVSCSSCHIGEGASWFVRSKLSGTRQVFATAFDSFERPIQTPIKDLRPARETCERCHWPEKAFGSKVVDLPHYATDEENTRRPLSMVLKTGGGDPSVVQVRGIHWHAVMPNQVEYVATDPKRMNIPWVRVTNEAGVQVYRSDGLAADAPTPDGEVRVMDCLDCHNRPSHNYRSPDELTNQLLSRGFIDASLPFFKREAAMLMAQVYEDTPTARDAITRGLEEFYLQNYPELASTRRAELDSGIEAVLGAYGNNFFPEMKTDWRTHPDHIGHKYSPGCFRCHDDQHVSAGGETIRRDCSLCHEFMEHREVEGRRILEHSEYRHPFELLGPHQDLNCSACHDGGATPAPTCLACHEEVAEFQAGRISAFPDIIGKPHPHATELECIDCHEEQQRFSPEEILPLCEMCHDEEEDTVFRQAQLAATEAARRKATDSPILYEVDRIRPIHNMEFGLQILEESGGNGTTERESAGDEDPPR